MRSMMVVVVMLCASVLLLAQSPTKYVWDQDAPTLAEANDYLYRAYVDGSTGGTALTTTCTGATSPFTCSAPFTLTAGTHTVQITAANNIGPSAKSAPLTITVAVPATPSNLRTQ